MFGLFKRKPKEPKKFNVGRTSITVTLKDGTKLEAVTQGEIISASHNAIYFSEPLAKARIENGFERGYFNINGAWTNADQVLSVTFDKTEDFWVEEEQ